MDGKKGRKKDERVSRRNFIWHGGAGALGAAASTVRAVPARGAKPLPAGYDRHRIIAQLGDTLIPSGPDDPGYQTLEPYNITAEVMKGLGSLPDADLALFDGEAGRLYGGTRFVELGEERRAEYLNRIVDGAGIPEGENLEKLRSIYRLVRIRVFVVYYQNYPYHTFPRDDEGLPIITAENEHQITNPNNPGLVTGWDVAGWKGPLTWEEEEERREHFKKVDWREY